MRNIVNKLKGSNPRKKNQPLSKTPSLSLLRRLGGHRATFSPARWKPLLCLCFFSLLSFSCRLNYDPSAFCPVSDPLPALLLRRRVSSRLLRLQIISAYLLLLVRLVVSLLGRCIAAASSLPWFAPPPDLLFRSAAYSAFGGF